MWKRLVLICIVLLSEIGVGLVMAHGAPDFAQYRRDSVTYPVLDLAELAARLGSIVTFDRRGDVVWLDDFEDGIQKWAASSGGAGASVAQSSATARNGGYSAALTAGSDGSRFAQLSRSVPLQIQSRVGLEYSFVPDVNVESVELDLRRLTPTLQLTSKVRYTRSGDVLAYQDSTGAWVTLDSDVSIPTAPSGFTTWKLVIDPVAEEYARLLFGGVTYDLADVALSRQVVSGWHRLAVTIYVTGDAGANGLVYVDDVIITQNEP